MTNTVLLREKISNSGYKIEFIAEKCGLSKQGFWKKLNNKSEFRASEIKVLMDLLGIAGEDAQAIFFCS